MGLHYNSRGGVTIPALPATCGFLSLLVA